MGCGSNSSPSSPAISAPAYTYPFLFQIGDYGVSGAGSGQFNAVGGVLVYHNALFVVDQLNVRVQKFDLDGNYLSQVSTGGTYPFGITVDGKGVIYISDWGNNTITKWDLNFNSLGTFTPSIATVHPLGLAVDSGNRVYVADGTGAKAIRCNSDGSSCVTVTGQFTFPTGITVDGGDYLYVVDNTASNVQKFNSSLASGATIIQSATGIETGAVHLPAAIAIDPDGNLLVTDHTTGGRIQKFSPSGSYMASLSAPLSETFSILNGITVDSGGNVYVPDFSHYVVYKYAPR